MQYGQRQNEETRKQSVGEAILESKRGHQVILANESSNQIDHHRHSPPNTTMVRLGGET